MRQAGGGAIPLAEKFKMTEKTVRSLVMLQSFSAIDMSSSAFTKCAIRSARVMMRALTCLAAVLLLPSAIAAAQETAVAPAPTSASVKSSAAKQPTAAPAPGNELVEVIPYTQQERAAHDAELERKVASGEVEIVTFNGQTTQSKNMPKAQTAAMRSAGGTSAQGPLSIVELARSLKNDPDLIYEYVRDNIETYPIWGMQKGGFGALIDGSGTAWDQADLMVKLLTQAGYTASYVEGVVQLTPAQIASFYGIPTTNVCTVARLFIRGGIEVWTTTDAGTYHNTSIIPNCAGTLQKVEIIHAWVKVNIGGTNYVFDPSHKPHTVKTGIDIGGATAYNPATFISGAQAGATVNSNYVQNINRNNVRSNLTNYTNNLIAHIRANKPAADLDDVLGGKVIAPAYGGSPLRQSAIPYQSTSYGESSYSAIPSGRRTLVTIGIQNQNGTAGWSLPTASDLIYGHRLSVVMIPGSPSVAKLMYDGEMVYTATYASGAGMGTPGTVTMTVTHNAYLASGNDQTVSQAVKFGGTYVVSNGWGPASRGLVDKFHKELSAARASGAADSSEEVLGSSLALVSASWLAKSDMTAYIADRLAGTNTIVHHRLGLAGYYDAPYVDLPANQLSITAEDGDLDKEKAVFTLRAMQESIFESNAVQETVGASAVSTVKLLDMASAAGYKIFDATSGNYSSAVAPNLINCSGDVAAFQSAINQGARLILPEHCDLTENSWSGQGHFKFQGNSIAFLISGGLYGGYTSQFWPTSTTVINSSFNLANYTQTSQSYLNSGAKLSWDPIDLSKGNYLHSEDNIAVGVGDYPYALKLSALYNSGGADKDGPLGKGWTHNFAIKAITGVDGFQGLGEDSPIDAASTIAAMKVSLDLLSDASRPLSKIVTATLAQRWFADQLLDNMVAVQQGTSAEVFVKLPDGSYNAPQGSSAKLVKNGDGSFSYTSADKNLLTLDTSGNATSWSSPNGARINFAYDAPGGKLVSVTNSVGRSLTFSYTGTRVTGVSDGTRNIAYGYDGAGNLTSMTDATSQTKTFQYDTSSRMTRAYHPANPSSPIVINEYDTLGRVKVQTSASGKVWNYYFAGSRSEEVAPDNARMITYFNAVGTTLAEIDNLLVGDLLSAGRRIVHVLDGRNRVIETAYPEGNKVQLTYDDTSCASADKRCTHNVLTQRLIAKPGGPADIVTSYTYEPSFNKVATAADARGKVTDYAYDPLTGNLVSVTAPAATPGGLRPQTTIGYTSLAGVGGLPSFTMPTSVTKKIDAANSVTTTTAYSAANRYVPQSSTVDPGGLNLTSTSTYDAVGNLTQVDGPRTDVSDVTQYAYDGERRPTQVTDAAGRFTRMFYDGNGNVIRTASQAPGGMWLALCKTYNMADKVSQARGASLVANDQSCPGTTSDITISDYAYDDQDRLMRVTQRQPAAQGGDRVTETAYYPGDQVKQVKRGVGTPLAQNYATYTYTANGKVQTLTDAKGQVTTSVYDGFDRLLALRHPAKSGPGASAPCNVAAYAAGDDCEVYSYDANGNVLAKRNRAGQTVAFTYDDLGRVTLKARPDTANNVTYAYDLLGRPTSIYQDSAAVQRHPVATTYDKAGRITQLVEDGWTSDYQYDKAGNRTLFRYPYRGASGSATNDGFYLTYDYDLLNRLGHIRENGAGSGIAVLATYAYDELSRPTSVTFGNGTTRALTYRSTSSVATIALNLDGASTPNDNVYTLAYNQIPQVSSVTTTNAAFVWTGHTNVNRNYGTNGLDQYTTSGTQALSYDDNGNLAGDQVRTFGYDAENQLVSAASSGLSLSYRYDALGRMDRRQRNSEVPTDYRYDGQSLIAAHDAGAHPHTQRYVHGAGVDAPIVEYILQGGTYARKWYAADHKGSVVATTDDAGATTVLYAYGDYGEVAPGATAGPAFRYTGQRLDPDSGLYYYKARWYSANLGRFLQTDPIGTEDQINLYAYVGNDPINMSDPTGMTSYGTGSNGPTGSAYTSSGANPARSILASNSPQNRPVMSPRIATALADSDVQGAMRESIRLGQTVAARYGTQNEVRVPLPGGGGYQTEWGFFAGRIAPGLGIRATSPQSDYSTNRVSFNGLDTLGTKVDQVWLHFHPNGSPLSDQDKETARAWGFGIVAFGPKGQVSYYDPKQ